MTARTPMAIELDAAAYDGATPTLGSFAKVAAAAFDTKNLAEMRAALAASGTAMTHVACIMSLHTTAQDAGYFAANSNRTHAIRGAIDSDETLAGRTPASEYLVIIRQIRAGFRLLVAIHRDLIRTQSSVSRATQEAQDNDEALSLLFDAVTINQGQVIWLDKLMSVVSARQSGMTPLGGAARRLL
jgi:hypothetical protein